MRIECKLIEAGKPTVNDHIYPQEVLEQMVEQAQEKVKAHRLLGSLGTSISSKVKLNEVSHMITELDLEDGKIIAEIEVLDTVHGKILGDMIESKADITLHPHFIAEVDGKIVKDAKVTSFNICLTDDALNGSS